jgi:hypothetical protein
MWNVWLQVRLLRVAWRQNVCDCILPPAACFSPVKCFECDILNARFVMRHSVGRRWPRRAFNSESRQRFQSALNDNQKKKRKEIRAWCGYMPWAMSAEPKSRKTRSVRCRLRVGVAGESLSTLAFHEANFFDAGALCRVRTLMGG